MPDDQRTAYYDGWEAKAKAIEEADKEEQAAAKAAEKPAEGPTIAKAEQERAAMAAMSAERTEILKRMAEREVTVSTPEECVDLGGKAVRIAGAAAGAQFSLAGQRVVKVFIEDCPDASVVLGDVVTQTVEVSRCAGVALAYDVLGTVQVDGSTVDLRATAVPGDVYHHNATVRFHLGERVEESSSTDGRQRCSRVENNAVVTQLVARDEREYPVVAPEAAAPESMAAAEKLKQQGNDAFRASDFQQAAALYSLALGEDPSNDVVLANRAQCWLKLGQPEKALVDAEECMRLAPGNVKGHFRKGLSLHALGRYGEAVQALAQAEKLDPKHEQVQHALKMAGMMAAKQAAA